MNNIDYNGFKAEVIGSNIVINTTNITKWTCYVSGNFYLNKYSGVGNTTIMILIPDSVLEANGTVEFVIDGYHCSSKLTLNINKNNDDYLNVSPTYVYFTNKGNITSINVSSSKPWSVTNDSNILIGNISASGFDITSNSDSDYNISITVSNGVKSQIITIVQKVEHIDDTCMLEVIKTPNEDNVPNFQLMVNSRIGSIFTPYYIVSKPNNINIIDDGLGNIRCSIIDILLDCIGQIVIKNTCGAIKNTTVAYIGEKVLDNVFYISHNSDKLTLVNIEYGKVFNWVNNNIKLIYNENYTFNIVSNDSKGNKISWYIKSYDEEIIEASTTQTTLTLKLKDYSKNSTPRSIILENNLGMNINLLFTVVDGLIDEKSTVFKIGTTTGNKSTTITTDYENTGITVYLDSYKIDGIKTNLKWICSNTDDVIKYIVNPMSASGGDNNRAIITANEDTLQGLDGDIKGVVVFQQMETYEYVYVNINHKAIDKHWVTVSTVVTAMTVSPTVVTVAACANQNSENITVIGFMETVEHLVDDAGTIYSERTTHTEKNITDIVNYNNPSADLIIQRNPPYLNVHSMTSNPYGNNDRIVNFTLTANGLSENIRATQDTASQGSSTYQDLAVDVNSITLVIEPTSFPRISGVTTSINKKAEVTIKSYIADSCGNINPSTERKRNETYINELTVKQINKDTVPGFTISSDYTTINIAENPWGYTFTKNEVEAELHFTDKDTPTQTLSITTKKNVDERKGEFVTEFTYNKPPLYVTKQSSIVVLTQSGGNEKEEYELIQSPSWVIITTYPVDGNFISSIDFNVEKNTTKEERLGEIIFRQKNSNKEIIYNIRQDARGIIPIPDFNYLVFRYYWNYDDGKDLDTATVFMNTGIEETKTESGVTSTFKLDDDAVGFGLEYVVKGLSNNIYLESAGDNTDSGNECVWVNYLEVCNEHNIDALPEEIYIDVYGIWYNRRGTGNIEIEVTAYKGGTMVRDPDHSTNFINEGGTVSFSNRLPTNVEASGVLKAETYKTDYTYIARVTYYKETQSAILQLMHP